MPKIIEMPTAHLWSRNLVSLLVGADPIEIAGLWQKMYEGTFWPGRRGLGIHALSAIDIALHDLAGKQLGKRGLGIAGGCFELAEVGRDSRRLCLAVGKPFVDCFALSFELVDGL